MSDARIKVARPAAVVPAERRSSPPTRTGGRPLDAATRAFFEPRFAHDFSQVRLRDDAHAAIDVAGAGARAYTVGETITLGRAPASTSARLRLLAHELTHVVQQRRGGATPALAPGSAHEREADRAATAVMAGDRVEVREATGIGLARDRDWDALREISVEELMAERDRVLAVHAGQSIGPDDEAYLGALDRQVAARASAADVPAATSRPTPFEQSLTGQPGKGDYVPVIKPGSPLPIGYHRTSNGVTTLFSVTGARCRTVGEVPSEATLSPLDFIPIGGLAVGGGRLAVSAARFGFPAMKVAGKTLYEAASLRLGTFVAGRQVTQASARLAAEAVEHLGLTLRGEAAGVARMALRRVEIRTATLLRQKAANPYDWRLPQSRGDWNAVVSDIIEGAEQSLQKRLGTKEVAQLRQVLMAELKQLGVEFEEVGSAGGVKTPINDGWKPGR